VIGQCSEEGSEEGQDAPPRTLDALDAAQHLDLVEPAQEQARRELLALEAGEPPDEPRRVDAQLELGAGAAGLLARRGLGLGLGDQLRRAVCAPGPLPA